MTTTTDLTYSEKPQLEIDVRIYSGEFEAYLEYIEGATLTIEVEYSITETPCDSPVVNVMTCHVQCNPEAYMEVFNDLHEDIVDGIYKKHPHLNDVQWNWSIGHKGI